jgi:hypothetical protein
MEMNLSLNPSLHTSILIPSCDAYPKVQESFIMHHIEVSNVMCYKKLLNIKCDPQLLALGQKVHVGASK